MQGTLMQQGLELMLFGMGTVFVFLALLVVATTGMSAMMQRFFKSPPAPVVRPQQLAVAQDNSQLVAVISAAIHNYRSRHKE